jgi:hypothetical protein
MGTNWLTEYRRLCTEWDAQYGVPQTNAESDACIAWIREKYNDHVDREYEQVRTRRPEWFVDEPPVVKRSSLLRNGTSHERPNPRCPAPRCCLCGSDLGGAESMRD